MIDDPFLLLRNCEEKEMRSFEHNSFVPTKRGRKRRDLVE